MKDADSSLYEAISTQLKDRPVADWVAPSWPPNRAKTGLFVEHLPFFFWPSAALSRLGVGKAALLSNLVYFLGALYLLFLLAKQVSTAGSAWVAVALYAVSPLGVMYLVRANHENAWAIGFLGALYCLIRLEDRARFRLGLVVFSTFAFLVKGVLALALFPVLLAWTLQSERCEMRGLRFLASALGSIVVCSAVLQWAYRARTGYSFCSEYFKAQIAYVAHFESEGVLKKLLNPVYYAANLLWFAAPSSLICAYLAFRKSRREQCSNLTQRILYICGGTYVALVCLMNRHAARYIFPAYSLLHPRAAQKVAGSSRISILLAQHERPLPYLLMLLLATVLVARVMVDPHFYRFIQVFRW